MAHGNSGDEPGLSECPEKRAFAGFLLGSAEASTISGMGAMDPHLFKVLPGILELGQMDHIIHALLGVLFLFGGLTTKTGQ